MYIFWCILVEVDPVEKYLEDSAADEYNHPDEVQGLDRHISDQIAEHRLYLTSPQAFSTSKVT